MYEEQYNAVGMYENLFTFLRYTYNLRWHNHPNFGGEVQRQPFSSLPGDIKLVVPHNSRIFLIRSPKCDPSAIHCDC